MVSGHHERSNCWYQVTTLSLLSPRGCLRLTLLTWSDSQSIHPTSVAPPPSRTLTPK